MIRTWAWAMGCAAAAMLATLGGCRAPGTPTPDEQVARQVPPFPQETPVGPPLDVVVVRDGGGITLVNRTPRSYRNVDLWLNEQYVRRIDAIEIGVNPTLPLRTFVNRFGESFPIGSFLRPERSAKLVLAEIHDPAANVRHKLIVQPPGTR